MHVRISFEQEVINGQEYNEMSDMWSLGCLIYELCACILLSKQRRTSNLLLKSEMEGLFSCFYISVKNTSLCCRFFYCVNVRKFIMFLAIYCLLRFIFQI